MTRSLQIKEYAVPLWKTGTVAFLLLAVVLFIIFWNTGDVFWSGIVRLASFISFAAAVLFGLKAMEGNLHLTISVSDGSLHITYLKKGQNVLEDSHRLEDITSVVSIQPKSFPSFNGGNVFVVRFKDSKQDFNLFHFGGRTLKIDEADAERLVEFLKEHNIDVRHDTEPV